MILGGTIEHLRDYCPTFRRNVAGTALFAQGLERYNANLPLPAAYVVALDQDSDGNRNAVGYFGIIQKTVGVIVELDATGDRRGQTPAMQYDAIEKELWRALLNWKPVECRVPGQQGYQFVGGRPLDLDRARLFYQWEFSLPFQLDTEDGWPGPEGEPLKAIEAHLYTAPPHEMPPPDERPPGAVIRVITNEDEEVEP